MPLPTLLMPAGLPPFLVSGYASQWEDPYAEAPMQTGHARKRRRWTSAGQVVNVALFLERDEMASFREWHRLSLKSGQRQFAARVKEQGAGMLWYAAFFVQMYEAEAMHLGRWMVRASLMLTGEPEVDAPNTAALSVDFSIPFIGSGAPTIDVFLSVDFSIDFEGP